MNGLKQITRHDLTKIKVKQPMIFTIDPVRLSRYFEFKVTGIIDDLRFSGKITRIFSKRGTPDYKMGEIHTFNVTTLTVYIPVILFVELRVYPTLIDKSNDVLPAKYEASTRLEFLELIDQNKHYYIECFSQSGFQITQECAKFYLV